MTDDATLSPTTRSAVAAVWALFAALALLMMGNGLLGVVIGVRSELEAFSTTVTGLILASYFAGFLVGSQITPRFMARVGHIRVFAGLSSLVATSALVHALTFSSLSWIALRFTFGWAMAGLYVVVESWLNEMVSNENRGRLMGVYMAVAMGGLALGQLLIGIGNPLEPTLFIIAGGLMTLAVAPVSLSIIEAPVFELPPLVSPFQLWAVAPLGVVTAIGSGTANGALIAMSGVYATQVGLSTVATGAFVAAAALGSVALQWPVGRMSDSLGRRRSILLVTTAAAVVAALGPLLHTAGWQVIGAMFLLGGLSYPMYSLALSHVVDVLPPGQAVRGSMAVVFLNGVGAIMGPLAASITMDLSGPQGFFWTIALVHALIGIYALARLVGRPKIEELTPEPWLAVPARSTFVLWRRRGSGPSTLSDSDQP